MKKFINLHHLNKILTTNKYNDIEKYDNKSIYNISDLAEYIYNNLYKMDDNEKKYLLNMCLSTYNIHNELLRFEFNYFNPIIQDINLQQFSSYVIKMLTRYQHKVGGFMLEDIIWTLYTYIDGKYNLSCNEIVFENTMPAFHIPKRNETLKDDILSLKHFYEFEETLIYLHKLTILLNKIAKNIKVSLKLIDSYRDDIIIIILHCKYN